MAKIRKCKLSWKPSGSDLVVDYRLYWSSKNPVSYNSNYIKLGNLTEVTLPDILMGIESLEGAIYLGITAVDKAGNESDMQFLPEPYYLSVPTAPVDLALTTLADFKITEPSLKAINQFAEKHNPDVEQSVSVIQKDHPQPPLKHVTTDGRIVDDFDLNIRKKLGISE